MSNSCVQRYSVCKDVLAMIAEYLAKQPYKDVVGMMNALQNDPKPMRDGKELEVPKLVVERPDGAKEEVGLEDKPAD